MEYSSDKMTKFALEEIKKLEKQLPEKDIELLKKSLDSLKKREAIETTWHRLAHASDQMKKGNKSEAMISVKNVQANFFLIKAIDKQKEIMNAKGHAKYPLEKEYSELMRKYYNQLSEEKKRIRP